jgi:hypothetical protein
MKDYRLKNNYHRFGESFSPKEFLNRRFVGDKTVPKRRQLFTN